MPAYVVKGIDGRFVAADDDDGFIADLEKKVVALVANPVYMTRHQPLPADDLLHVRGKHGVAAIEFAVQAVAVLGL